MGRIGQADAGASSFRAATPVRMPLLWRMLTEELDMPSAVFAVGGKGLFDAALRVPADVAMPWCLESCTQAPAGTA